MKLSTKLIIGIAVLAIIGFGGYAFAHDGYGYGGDGWYGHHMMGYGPHMGYGPGYGPHMGYYDYGTNSGLSDSEIKKIEKAREDFFKSTEKTREALYENRIELRKELSKTNPDTGKLKTIQKKISKLEAELDQKSLEFEVEANKIAPNTREGFAGRGYGRGGYCR